ncbi:Gfo/Idh/MocA family oxidoreductase [bacterium]|nr:Gfo/Idh/MocA family oxidoreductase [bacterium]
MAKKEKMIRVGVVGVGRGAGFARGAVEPLGMELVALCDIWEERLNSLGKELNVSTYTDYDKFLEHDMDAVVLANYFHQHAPFAIKALKADKHVMSETSACFTLAEGVALIEAVEKSGKIYSFAENYPYMVFNQEMRRLYQKGDMGKFLYGEGEYVHPMKASSANSISPGMNHWRNWHPATYYCTHSLGPVMFITDTLPVKVNGFVVPYDFYDKNRKKTVRVGDMACSIITRMDNGAIVKAVHGGLRGHGNWVRIHCNRGLMENLRVGDSNMLRVRKEPFDKNPDEPIEKIYKPEFPSYARDAGKYGHAGGDFFTNYFFAQAIKTGEQPYLDVYKGVAMSITGILAYRSALNDSNTLEVPDLRKKSERAKYAKDDWNPDPTRYKEGYPLPSILGDIKPSKEGVVFAKKIWAAEGYREKEQAKYGKE